MHISSRTPEGEPNLCPICGQDTVTEPSSVPTRDAPCPHCGCLLWFDKAGVPAVIQGIARGSYEELIMSAGKERLGPFPSELLLRLVVTCGVLARAKRPPTTARIQEIVTAAGSWQEALQMLPVGLRQRNLKTWPYRAGAFVRKVAKAVARLGFARA
jgi:hypothetical protein